MLAAGCLQMYLQLISTTNQQAIIACYQLFFFQFPRSFVIMLHCDLRELVPLYLAFLARITWPLKVQGRFPFRQNFWLGRFKCKLNAWFDRKFSRTNRRPSEVFHFYRFYGLEQKFLFHLRNSVFPSLVHRQSQFFHSNCHLPIWC